MMPTDGMKPKFTPRVSQVTSLTGLDAATDMRQWLAGSEQESGERRDAGLDWLLATTFSEVVWGLKKDGEWRLSPVGASLPADRLLELRAFGPDAEIFVWRDATGLRARRRLDGPDGEDCDTYEEEQLLWGTVRQDGAPDGFTRLADGEQGLVHEPPLELDDNYFITNKQDKRFGHRPARLVLRHYVQRDPETGLARVVDSRLVKVRMVKPKTIPAKETELGEHDGNS